MNEGWNQAYSSRDFLAAKLEAAAASPGEGEAPPYNPPVEWLQYVASGQWNKDRVNRARHWGENYHEMGWRAQDFVHRMAGVLGADLPQLRACFAGQGQHPIVLPNDPLAMKGVRGEVCADQVKGFYSNLSQVACLDISQKLALCASQNWADAGMEEGRVIGWQRDVTNSDGIGYEALLAKIFGDFETEAELLHRAEPLERIYLDHIRKRTDRALARLSDIEPAQILPGEVDVSRSFVLKKDNGETDVPIQLWLYQNMLGGLGAAAESRIIWNPYAKLLKQAQAGKGAPNAVLPDNNESREARRQFHERIFRIISLFGTAQCCQVFEQVAANNPDARQYAVFDKNTITRERGWPAFPRVRIQQLLDYLREIGMKADVMDEWKFNDQEDHSHTMVQLEVSGTPKEGHGIPIPGLKKKSNAPCGKTDGPCELIQIRTEPDADGDDAKTVGADAIQGRWNTESDSPVAAIDPDGLTILPVQAIDAHEATGPFRLGGCQPCSGPNVDWDPETDAAGGSVGGMPEEWLKRAAAENEPIEGVQAPRDGVVVVQPNTLGVAGADDQYVVELGSESSVGDVPVVEDDPTGNPDISEVADGTLCVGPGVASDISSGDSPAGTRRFIADRDTEPESASRREITISVDGHVTNIAPSNHVRRIFDTRSVRETDDPHGSGSDGDIDGRKGGSGSGDGNEMAS